MTIFPLLCLLILFSQVQAKKYKITDQVYMDLEIDGRMAGRIVFGLFGEVVPKTVKNFKKLALEGIEGKSYKGTNIFIAIRKVMILGGDVIFNNGSGSTSIYGKYFDDENFEIRHDSTGLLASANRDVPNTNGCMFFITTMPTPWLNGKNVIFGKVLMGHEVVHKIEHLKTDYNDRILNKVQIVECGEIVFEPFYDDHKNYEITLWAWIKAGWFPLSFSFAILGVFHYIMTQLNKLQSFQ
ncbi:hypothetical protein ABEB36_013172 [Hypothenemus hampei]|uniref:Peptidyl-prolyl cis-trans isomerase n=1 Tax=Hypothenemus hampei TaxID=57062 RepID=A0ABD1E952_HYPHA